MSILKIYQFYLLGDKIDDQLLMKPKVDPVETNSIIPWGTVQGRAITKQRPGSLYSINHQTTNHQYEAMHSSSRKTCWRGLVIIRVLMKSFNPKLCSANIVCAYVYVAVTTSDNDQFVTKSVLHSYVVCMWHKYNQQISRSV